jgi:hypothetical protein
MPFYRCTVNEIGPASDGTETPAPVVYINLTDTAGSFGPAWFFAGAGAQNQMLSVGVAAINSSKHVEVAAVAPNSGNNPSTEVRRMYLLTS